MARKIPEGAFDHYVGLGPGRSYEAVAQHFGVTKRGVAKHAAKERWQERVAELERKARKGAEEKALETLETMNLRHLKALKVVQGKALDALRGTSLQTAMEAVRALDLAIKGERTIRGEPSDRTAISVEDVIRREYERWMVPEESGDDDDAAEAQAQESHLPR